MRRTSEKGEGRMGGFLLLIALLVGALAAWNVAPAYFDHYDFTDKVNEICRMPKYRVRGDDGVVAEGRDPAADEDDAFDAHEVAHLLHPASGDDSDQRQAVDKRRQRRLCGGQDPGPLRPRSDG